MAALIVVIYHAKFVLWSGGQRYLNEIGIDSVGGYVAFAFDMLSSSGKQCVIFFFILSAVVTNYSFDKHKYTLKSFYGFRAIRIYVPYIFSVLLSVASLLAAYYYNNNIFLVEEREYNASIKVAFDDLSALTVYKAFFFIPNETYAGGNFAYWSLLHEALFYLIFPIYKRLRNVTLLALLIIFAIGFYFFNIYILYYQCFFVVGIFFYRYFRVRSTTPVIQKEWLFFLLLLTFYAILNVLVKVSHQYLSDAFAIVVSLLVMDYTLYFVQKPKRLLVSLGNISYSLYLNHLSILLLFYAWLAWLLKEHVFYDRIYYYSGAILAVSFSLLLYYVIERPSLKLVYKLKKRHYNAIHQPGFSE
ncbi:acyltransferase [Pontibacter sp. BT310]|uniref:Acyltransferase n=1 Tax=Pontibacter populi TaxID=890055 RepID=A0ABS6XFT8_9BACT|nr:acyltransferase [Pontibacter sp. BT310]MBR0572424.1 acyltransferase [Microvirga sp. STS03]MBW3366848.1 acyltransferase [Pontibacter populi]